MKLRWFWLGLLGMGSCYAQQAYYVSPSGNDANNGSAGSPWQHVSYALQHVHSGDTLVLMDGVYNEKIQIPFSGLSIRARNPRGAVLDGTGLTGDEAMIRIQNRSDIHIQGVEIRNNVMNDAVGILVAGSGQNIAIENCYIHDIHFSADAQAAVTEQTNAQGIVVYGIETTPYTGIRITGNELSYCRLGYSEGIALNGNVENFEISGNYVHHLTNIGIDIIGGEGTCGVDSLDVARNGLVARNRVEYCRAGYASSAGIYVDGGQHIRIFYNRCAHNGFGMEIGCENPGHEARDVVVRNNFLLLNDEAGMAFGGYDYPGGSGRVRNCDVSNNTFWLNDGQQTGTGSLFLTYAEDCIVQNNIFVTAADDLLYAENTQPGLVMDYNLYYDTDGDDSDNGFDFDGTAYNGLADFRSGTGLEIHGFYLNPQIQTDTTGLPRLTSSSPFNTGNPGYTPRAGETDYFGQERMVGAAVDNGAEEWQNLTVDSTGADFGVYPNPFDNILFLPPGKAFHYRLIDACGRVLLRGMVKDFLRTGNLARGVYRLQLTRLRDGHTKIIPLIRR